MRFCGIEAKQIPCFDDPMPSFEQELEANPTGEGMLGHACRGEQIEACSKMWAFKKEDLAKHQMTQLQALEMTCCRICRTPPVPVMRPAHG